MARRPTSSTQSSGGQYADDEDVDVASENLVESPERSFTEAFAYSDEVQPDGQDDHGTLGTAQVGTANAHASATRWR